MLAPFITPSTPSQKIQEEWYESLHNWEAAYTLYSDKSYLRPEDINLTLGRMRCLNAMGEWTKLYEIACESWGLGDDNTRKKMAVMASASAWGLGQWESMEEYCKSIHKNTPEGAVFQALMSIHKGQFAGAQEVSYAHNTTHNNYCTLYPLVRKNHYIRVHV